MDVTVERLPLDLDTVAANKSLDFLSTFKHCSFWLRVFKDDDNKNQNIHLGIESSDPLLIATSEIY